MPMFVTWQGRIMFDRRSWRVSVFFVFFRKPFLSVCAQILQVSANKKKLEQGHRKRGEMVSFVSC